MLRRRVYVLIAVRIMTTTRVIISYQWGAGNKDKTAMASLKEEVALVADRELRENKSTREKMLEQFREWIRKNPDICNCRTGS
jgi:hypothetical protein